MAPDWQKHVEPDERPSGSRVNQKTKRPHSEILVQSVVL